MKSQHLPADPAVAADALVVLLPGAYNQPADFVAAGFATIAREAGRRFDLVLPELDLTQLSSGDALPLLHDEVILPARAAGAKTIWLGGVSLGGFNSLVYAERYQGTAGDIDGLCLLAPWPGSRITRKLIEAAGGLDSWTPSADELAGDAELRVWHWLRERRQRAARRPIFLGWGSDDRFAGGIAAYAAASPDATVEALPGGHDWPVWAALWQRFCARGML